MQTVYLEYVKLVIIGRMFLYFLLIALTGWVGGMLVNYLADVLPHGRRLVRPFCYQCQAAQPWGNYLLWPRRCAQCGARRPLRVYVVEACMILLALYLWSDQGRALPFAPSMAWMVFFGVVMVIDIEHRLILHPVSAVGAVMGLFTGIWLHGLRSTLIGGAVGFGSMLAFYLLGIGFVMLMSWLRGPVDEVALGYGDVNLSAVIGLLLGWQAIVWGLIITLLLAGAASLSYMVFMKLRGLYRHDLALPFGPFLVSSALLLMFLKELVYSIWRLL